MKFLDLFCGTKSITNEAKKFGYKVISLDKEEKYEPTIVSDIMNWEYKKYKPQTFKIIWASPPCTEFSKAKTRGERKIKEALKIVKKTKEIIEYLKPKYYYIENPEGLLRHQKIMKNMNRETVSYCKYGYKYRKNTDKWTNRKDLKLKRCIKGEYCKYKKEHGVHEHTVQDGTSKTQKHEYINTRDMNKRISIPKKLVREILKN